MSNNDLTSKTKKNKMSFNSDNVLYKIKNMR